MRPENSPPPWSEARGARRQAVAFAHDPIGPATLWVLPIRNSIDMLATGIKSPVGIKVAGADLAAIDMLTTQIEAAVKTVPGVSSALAERLSGGPYIDIDVDHLTAARYGL